MNYDCHFGGTSAACPLVSGSAALLMSKNPALNFEAYYYILRHSAVTDLDTGSFTPPNNEYGYGRVDAFRAILSLSHGDVNNDGDISILDVTYLTSYFYRHGPAPFPSERLADVDCSGSLDGNDVTYLVDYAFRHGPPPPAPCFEF